MRSIGKYDADIEQNEGSNKSQTINYKNLNLGSKKFG